MTNTMTIAWNIRKEAAAKYNCKVSEIDMGMCLVMAHKRNRVTTIDKIIKTVKTIAFFEIDFIFEAIEIGILWLMFMLSNCAVIGSTYFVSNGIAQYGINAGTSFLVIMVSILVIVMFIGLIDINKVYKEA